MISSVQGHIIASGMRGMNHSESLPSTKESECNALLSLVCTAPRMTQVLSRGIFYLLNLKQIKGHLEETMVDEVAV